MSVNQIFDQSKGALAANSKALSVTSHNISNANTEGYSRQRVELESLPPREVSAGRVGGGVNVRGVTRAHTSFVARRMEQVQANVGQSEHYSGMLHQIEDVFADDAEKGLNKSFTDFFNDVRNLSTQPNSTPMRSAVVESAKTLSSRFQTVRGSLDGIKDDIDARIQSTVDKVNSLTSKIAELNKQIQIVEANHGHANDERDARDLALQNLSKCIDIQVTELDHGAVTVSAGRLGAIVANADAFRLEAFRATKEGNYFDGAMHVGMKTSTGKTQKVMSDFVKGGELGAYLQARDVALAEVAEKVDNLAFNFANEVNATHRQAFTLNGQPGGELFSTSSGPRDASKHIQVNGEIASNPSALAAGISRNAPGDNRALLRMADLESAKVIGGQSSFSDFAGEMIARVGIQAKGAEETLENQRGILQQLENLREQESGVSLDEEALNMVKYQKAFDASAKMIQVADSMLETVINLKRF
jgi:flagellar hook-associated protein 1 FlgK